MRKVLFGLGLVMMLSACSSPDEPAIDVDTDAGEQSLVKNDVASHRQEEEIIAEPESVADPEPEINGLEKSSVVKSQSSNMDFSTCLQQQTEFAGAISSSGNYNVIPIVDTNILSIVKFCTNDDSIIHTCSKPDNKMILTVSTNKEGC